MLFAGRKSLGVRVRERWVAVVRIAPEDLASQCCSPVMFPLHLPTARAAAFVSFRAFRKRPPSGSLLEADHLRVSTDWFALPLKSCSCITPFLLLPCPQISDDEGGKDGTSTPTPRSEPPIQPAASGQPGQEESAEPAEDGAQLGSVGDGVKLGTAGGGALLGSAGDGVQLGSAGDGAQLGTAAELDTHGAAEKEGGGCAKGQVQEQEERGPTAVVVRAANPELCESKDGGGMDAANAEQDGSPEAGKVNGDGEQPEGPKVEGAVAREASALEVSECAAPVDEGQQGSLDAMQAQATGDNSEVSGDAAQQGSQQGYDQQGRTQGGDGEERREEKVLGEVSGKRERKRGRRRSRRRDRDGHQQRGDDEHKTGVSRPDADGSGMQGGIGVHSQQQHVGTSNGSSVHAPTEGRRAGSESHQHEDNSLKNSEPSRRTPQRRRDGSFANDVWRPSDVALTPGSEGYEPHRQSRQHRDDTTTRSGMPPRPSPRMRNDAWEGMVSSLQCGAQARAGSRERQRYPNDVWKRTSPSPRGAPGGQRRDDRLETNSNRSQDEALGRRSPYAASPRQRQDGFMDGRQHWDGTYAKGRQSPYNASPRQRQDRRWEKKGHHDEAFAYGRQSPLPSAHGRQSPYLPSPGRQSPFPSSPGRQSPYPPSPGRRSPYPYAQGQVRQDARKPERQDSACSEGWTKVKPRRRRNNRGSKRSQVQGRVETERRVVAPPEHTWARYSTVGHRSRQEESARAVARPETEAHRRHREKVAQEAAARAQQHGQVAQHNGLGGGHNGALAS
eukprot:evm.model.scf_280EXC.11 EVM.evm.TU.scf_280EXC.11   scf_280EXC:64716-67070(-)